MTQEIVNGASTVISLGTNDLSTRVAQTPPREVPQHLPLFYIFSPRGKGKHLVDGVAAVKTFGAATLDPRSVYYNHSSHFAALAIKNANSCALQRLVPTDAGPMANAILWLDVLQTTVDRYRRNPDGSIYQDNFGEPEVIGTAPGLKLKWVKTHRTTIAEQDTIGDKTQAAGDQEDPTTLVQSVRYPMFEIQEYCQGADGNNTGFRMWAMSTAGGSVIPKAMMTKYNAFPFKFSLVSRKDETATVTYEKTIFGESDVMFTFQKNVINPVTNQRVSYDQILVQSYNQTGVPGYPDVNGRMSKFYVYDANYAAVLALLYNTEKDYIDVNSDITEDTASKGLLNLVSLESSSGVRYQTAVFVDSATSVRLSQSNPVFLEGGSDGTMSNTMYETLVQAEMDRYLDATDPVIDIARNVESVIYDTGFTLDTKLKLTQIIGVRKDTAVILGTHVVGEAALTESEEHAIAVSLRTRLQLYPESDYFGTPVMRGMIMGRSGITRDSEYVERIPATYEVLDKFSKYMGAGNGAWKSGKSPEGYPGNRVSVLKDINIEWISDSVRNRNWDAGLNWVLTYDLDDLFVPAYKTVYPDDTSVLNSMLTVLAICELNKVVPAVWRELTGRSDLSNAQLCDLTNSRIRAKTQGRFDNRFTIQPVATVTDLDKARGFSWSAPVKIFAKNTKTVMTTFVEAYRQEDLEATSTNANGG